MRIAEVHIMPHCMENRFPTIMQIESILIGMGMIARTERTGTKTQADILFLVLRQLSCPGILLKFYELSYSSLSASTSKQRP